MGNRVTEIGPIVVIDDDETMRRACHATLKRDGYMVETYSDGPSGLERIEQAKPGLIIVDLKMPGMGGMEVIDRAQRIDPEIVIIVITGFATVATAVEAMKAGAYDFIPKPFTAQELRVIIKRAVTHRLLAIEAQQLRAEKEAQARRFITFVSHQLQSPLGAVRQYLDVLTHLMGDEIPTNQRGWIERCRAKTTQMLDIIGDWLTLSKVEGGQLATERVPVQWKDLVAEVLNGLKLSAEERRITLRDEIPETLPPVIGDPSALRMLFSNLVDNALKYSQEGGEVCVRATADQHEVCLSVADRGVGISAENQQHVFEDFFRVKDGTVRTSGTGMGLPICKKIAEELAGDISLTSELGQGSTFTVVLPRAKTGSELADEPADEPPLGCA